MYNIERDALVLGIERVWTEQATDKFGWRGRVDYFISSYYKRLRVFYNVSGSGTVISIKWSK